MSQIELTGKSLMVLANSNLADLQSRVSTGMNFHIIQNLNGFLAVYQDGPALPLYADPRFYSVDDLLAGVPVPTARVTVAPIVIQQSFSNRFHAAMALQTAVISRSYTGAIGAFPLIATDTLKVDTVFRRYISGLPDRRFVSGQLTAGTYLTSEVDSAHADSGFGAVGRYALPIPLPVKHVIQYELPVGTHIEVGTVAPNFGQAGGGVEIHLPNITNAVQVGTFTLPDY